MGVRNTNFSKPRLLLGKDRIIFLDQDGIWSDDQDHILQVFAREFHKRFHKDPKTSSRIAIPFSTDISEDDNLRLTRESTMTSGKQFSR